MFIISVGSPNEIQMMQSPGEGYSHISSASPHYHVLLPLLYFEIFQYPLRLAEIQQFSPVQQYPETELPSVLAELVEWGWLYQIDGYYLTRPRRDWVDLRKENNKRAARYLGRARLMTRLIRRFPFVRAVLISGSLSKGVMPKDGDIDYFIITKPQRLWIARTALVLFKKLFLFNSHKYFCVNYFIDEHHLEIEEKNIFTATEVATLLPIYSAELYQSFIEANGWVRQFYPRSGLQSLDTISRANGSRLRNLAEWPFTGRLGDQLDRWCMLKTMAYWRRKFTNIQPEQFAVALKSRTYVSKHHPQNFQNKVLHAFERVIEDFEERNQLRIEKPLILVS